ncbi:MAG TPA: YmdB family metallophosphoesterase, partial [Chthoniobacterales bacterium]
AFLCDAGMCGPINSILGRAVDPIMNRFISNLPASFPVAGGEVRLRGAVIEIDESTGRAVRITRVDEPGPGVTASSEPEPKIDVEQAPSPEQT